jgi:hypothetical protein
MKKITGTHEAWESGQLGQDAAHAKPAPRELEAAVEASLGMQMISIRLPKQLVDAYRMAAAHHGVGYQPLMRDMLQRAAPELVREVLDHHAAKASEVDTQMEMRRKAA